MVFRRLFISFSLLLSVLSAGAGEDPSPIVAVLSSEGGPYREAFSSFQQEWGRGVPVVLMEKEGRPKLPPGVRTIIAFGGKAARADYPPDATLIYCLSPAAGVSTENRQAPTIGISLMPRPDVLAAQLKTLQPEMRRLGILWHSSSFENQLKSLEKAFSALGIEVLIERLQDKDQLPKGLRHFLGRVDALWIPPDPVLISEQTMVALKEFSSGNNIPYYAPTGGLVEAGAVASVSITFGEIGRAAARAARGPTPSGFLYVDKVEIVLNPKAAAACGLTFPPEAVKRATRVVSP